MSEDAVELHPAVAALAQSLESDAAGLTLPPSAVESARSALRHADDDAWEHLLAWTHRVVASAGQDAASVRAAVCQLLAERLGSEEAAADRFVRSAPDPGFRESLGQAPPRRAPTLAAAPESRPVRAVRGLRSTPKDS